MTEHKYNVKVKISDKPLTLSEQKEKVKEFQDVFTTIASEYYMNKYKRNKE